MQKDIRDIARFVTSLKVFALHGRKNGLDREECAALLTLVSLMMDPVNRLIQDHGVESDL